MKSKSCELDTVPTYILKEILSACLESLTIIVNLSLTMGEFSGEWKTAIICPLLKKTGLEPINKNYRPVSNLCLHLQTSTKMYARSTHGSLPTTQSPARLPVCILEKLQHREQPTQHHQ